MYVSDVEKKDFNTDEHVKHHIRTEEKTQWKDRISLKILVCTNNKMRFL